MIFYCQHLTNRETKRPLPGEQPTNEWQGQDPSLFPNFRQSPLQNTPTTGQESKLLLESDCLGSNPDTATFKLITVGKFLKSLCLDFLICKMGIITELTGLQCCSVSHVIHNLPRINEKCSIISAVIIVEVRYENLFTLPLKYFIVLKSYPQIPKIWPQKNKPRAVCIGGNDQRADSFSLIVTNIATLTSQRAQMARERNCPRCSAQT